MDSLLDGLANLGKTCDHGVAGVISALIFGEDQLVTVGNAYDHSWRKHWIFTVSTGRADHLALMFIMYHRFAAAAAETALAVPLKELISGDSCESQILWLRCAENSCDLKLITRKETGVKIRDQIKMLFVNGEEIDIILIEIFNFSFQLSKAWKSHSLAIFFHKDLSFFIGEDVAFFIRGHRFVLIVIGMWCDILDHDR